MPCLAEWCQTTLLVFNDGEKPAVGSTDDLTDFKYKEYKGHIKCPVCATRVPNSWMGEAYVVNPNSWYMGRKESLQFSSSSSSSSSAPTFLALPPPMPAGLSEALKKTFEEQRLKQQQAAAKVAAVMAAEAKKTDAGDCLYCKKQPSDGMDTILRHVWHCPKRQFKCPLDGCNLSFTWEATLPKYSNAINKRNKKRAIIREQAAKLGRDTDEPNMLHTTELPSSNKAWLKVLNMALQDHFNTRCRHSWQCSRCPKPILLCEHKNHDDQHSSMRYQRLGMTKTADDIKTLLVSLANISATKDNQQILSSVATALREQYSILEQLGQQPRWQAERKEKVEGAGAGSSSSSSHSMSAAAAALPAGAGAGAGAGSSSSSAQSMAASSMAAGSSLSGQSASDDVIFD